jgi:hypothetical protein
MTNKIIGKGIFASMGLGILTLIFEDVLGYELAEGVYALAGLGMMFFGIWGGVRLIKAGN